MWSATAPTRMSEGLIGRLVRGPPPPPWPPASYSLSNTCFSGALSSRRHGVRQPCLALRGRTFGWLLYSVLSFSQALSLASFE
ncbi:unnamed protein product [Ixodes pacificus]